MDDTKDAERTYPNFVYRGEPGPSGTVVVRSLWVPSKEVALSYLEKGWYTDSDQAQRASPLDPSPQVLIERLRNEEQQRREDQAARERRNERLEQVLNKLTNPILDPASPTKTYKTALGKNIARLKKDCGWTFDDLAAAVDLSRNAVLGHVNEGSIPRPDTLVTYARVFSEKLGRRVTVEELES